MYKYNEMQIIMPETQKQQLGKQGELKAVQYLEKKGQKILITNYRYKHLEIDIISLQDNTLIISEVKSFNSPELGAAEYRVTKNKQQNMIKAAYAFLNDNKQYEDYGVRFDIIIVDFSKYPLNIRHYEGAFWADRW